MQRPPHQPDAREPAASSAGSAVPDTVGDGLLQSLVWLCGHHGRPRSAQSLLSAKLCTREERDRMQAETLKLVFVT